MDSKIKIIGKIMSTEKQLLLSEISMLKKMIKQTPPEKTIDLLSLKHRLKIVRQKIKELN